MPYFYAQNNPNLYCIDVDSAALSIAFWIVANGNIDSQHYFSNNCTGTSIEEHQSEKILLKIVDILARESSPNKNGLLFYIYSDGTAEKRVVIE